MMTLILCLLIIPPGEELNLKAPFLMISHKKTSRLEEMLNEAAAAGFKVVQAGTNNNDELNLLLQKTADSSRSYRILAETDRSSLKSALIRLGEQGYHLIPSSIVSRGRLMGNKMFLAVMELDTKVPAADYKVLISSMDVNLQSVLEKLTEDQYKIVGMLADKDEIYLIFLEKAP